MSEQPVLYERSGRVALVLLHNPPVNALGLAVRQGLVSALYRADEDPEVCAVVLAGTGRGFSAGGDIREFGTPQVTAAPRLTLDVHPVIERMSKPVVAALHGMALGGGLETAMACHLRVAVADTLVALPEVSLGLIPLSGTQRLPRLVGLDRAIDLILSGARRPAADFAGTALFDHLLPPGATETQLRETAAALASQALQPGARPPLVSQRPIIGEHPWKVLAVRKRDLAARGASRAEHAALEAIAAAVETPDFHAALSQANAICERLLAALPDARN